MMHSENEALISTRVLTSVGSIFQKGWCEYTLCYQQAGYYCVHTTLTSHATYFGTQSLLSQ